MSLVTFGNDPTPAAAVDSGVAFRLEQQLMARMICGQAPPPLPEQNEQSDAEEPSLASGVGERRPAADIWNPPHVQSGRMLTFALCLRAAAEAAGGGGLQFFVDAGVQVDSPLVKELVTEVLSEMVDQVLAPREPPVPGPAPDRGPRPGPNPGPGGPSSFQGKTVPVVPVVPVVVTPLPTPPPSPVASIEEPLALSTPAPSEATSLLIDDSPEPSVAAPPGSAVLALLALATLAALALAVNHCNSVCRSRLSPRTRRFMSSTHPGALR